MACVVYFVHPQGPYALGPGRHTSHVKISERCAFDLDAAADLPVFAGLSCTAVTPHVADSPAAADACADLAREPGSAIVAADIAQSTGGAGLPNRVFAQKPAYGDVVALLYMFEGLVDP